MNEKIEFDKVTIEREICNYFEERAKEEKVSLAEFMAKNIKETFSCNVDIGSDIIKVEKNDEAISSLCSLLARKEGMRFDDYILAVSGYAFGMRE